MDITGRIVHFFESSDSPKKVRLGRVIDKIGLDEFKKAIKV